MGESLRISVDERTNSLILKAANEALISAEAILKHLDQPTDDDNEAEEEEELSGVTIRVFWLCQGSPHADAAPASRVLPTAVCKGLAKIGLNAPYVVSQAVTSLALPDTDDFEAFLLRDVRSNLFGKEVWLNVEGHLRPIDEEQLQFNMETTCKESYPQKTRNTNTFSGSVVTPLDHYVILGTTSYATGSTYLRYRIDLLRPQWRRIRWRRRWWWWRWRLWRRRRIRGRWRLWRRRRIRGRWRLWRRRWPGSWRWVRCS